MGEPASDRAQRAGVNVQRNSPQEASAAPAATSAAAAGIPSAAPHQQAVVTASSLSNQAQASSALTVPLAGAPAAAQGQQAVVVAPGTSRPLLDPYDPLWELHDDEEDQALQAVSGSLSPVTVISAGNALSMHAQRFCMHRAPPVLLFSLGYPCGTL